MNYIFDLLKYLEIALFNYSSKKRLLGCFLLFFLFSTEILVARAISFDNSVSPDNVNLVYLDGTSEWSPSQVTYESITRKLTTQYPFVSPFNLTHSELRLKFTLDCSTPNVNGLATVGMHLFYIMDGSLCNSVSDAPYLL